MNPIATVIISLLVFGFLIFIHEFGHYITARIFGVAINEFSIGMGPKLFSRVSQKTGIRDSIAMLPIGGFVAMEGEDGESSNPNSFDKKPAWQRFIITAAGAFVNILFGFIAMIVLTSIIKIGGTTIGEFVDTEQSGFESSTDEYFELGDKIVAVDGKRVKIYDELSYEVMRRGNKPIDVTVIRNGEEITIPDVVFPTLTEQEQTFGMIDFRIYATEKTFGSVMTYSFRKSFLIVRMCWESIFDLISGRYSLAAVSGPVGISGAIGDAAGAGFSSLLYIVTLISINLGVMNLLPIPALDGGRLICVTFELITRKRLPRKLEATINAVGLILLLALSAVIMIKDVFQLIL